MKLQQKKEDYLVGLENKYNLGGIMKVIIKDRFYDIQTSRTDDIFDSQKNYLMDMIKNCEEKGDVEKLMTSLLTLNNLSEALIHQVVDKYGEDKTLEALNAVEI